MSRNVREMHGVLYLPTFVCAVPSAWNAVPYLLPLATSWAFFRPQLRLQVFLDDSLTWSLLGALPGTTDVLLRES